MPTTITGRTVADDGVLASLDSKNKIEMAQRRNVATSMYYGTVNATYKAVATTPCLSEPYVVAQYCATTNVTVCSTGATEMKHLEGAHLH